MKQLFLLFFSSSGILMAQSILPPQFSHDSGFYTEDFDLVLSHENPEVKIIYTLDGSEPSIDNLQGRSYQYKKKYPLYPGQQPFEFYTNVLVSNVYDAPLLITDMTNKPNRLSEIATSNEFYHYFPTHNLFKGNVIRAKAYLNGEASETVTKNMFVTEDGVNKFSLPIFSLSIDDEELFGYENGLFVAGRLFDEWRLANPNTLVTDAQPDANYLQSGSSSERKLNINFFNNGIPQLNQYVGIRNHGNFSRHFNNRSFRFYAKSDYGKSKMSFPFFEDYDFNSFKRLILRNSGNDTFATMFKDAYIQTLTKHLPFEFQAYQPSIVFVNAEYFGLFNLRERYDAKYFERIYNIKEKDLDILESQGIVDTGDDVAFVEMITFLNNNDLDTEENYNWLDKRVDIENFTDYYITEIFVGNTDWPVNNYEYWRKRVPYSEDAAYGHDGKFRWMLKDTDISYYPKEVNNN